MKKLLLATRGKVVTLQNVEHLTACARGKEKFACGYKVYWTPEHRQRTATKAATAPNRRHYD
jgi:hypothetical protein